MAGKVLVADQKVEKPGTQVKPDVSIRILGDDPQFVSRGGLKLIGALDRFQIDPQNLTCLDVGISTGGFTDCLLQRGAARIYGVDVGYGQVAMNLRNDPRLVLFERTNFRYFDPALIPEPIDLAVVDVSFISLTLILKKIFLLLSATGQAVCLIKPQFEVGKSQVGKGGVVRDPAKHEMAIEKIHTFAVEVGYQVKQTTASDLLGPKGNREFFIHLLR